MLTFFVKNSSVRCYLSFLVLPLPLTQTKIKAMEITLTCLCLRDSSLVKSTKPFHSDIALEIGNRNLCKPSYCTSWSHKQLIEYGVTFVIV